ncbi:MAG: histidine kinase [Parcubacteria group bacterium Greene0714_21]|nr:MAG: histidine kinase [Parcubacteria group bacterium Greene0416_39]TSC97777.1 MAG: histidine kinase [Parcubacteria group bacterium Greene1014_47]TSD04251.1 MAG: histidine kinase [Parcubacteria group bacterium Greene0714_21]
MDIQNFVLIAALFANTFLVLLLLEQAKKSVSIAVFTISVGTVAAWTFAMFLYRSGGAEQALLFGRLLYVSAMLIPLTFLYFSFLFPAVKSTLTKQKIILLTIIPTLLGILLFPTNHIISGVFLRPGMEKVIVFGSLYFFYVTYISGYFIWALFNLWQKYWAAKEPLKTQISYIITGTLISIVFGSTFNLFLPSIGDFRFNWLGNVMTLFMVSFITYAIVKKQLFEIRIFLTQLLVGVVAALLLINFLTSQTPFEYFWKGVLFATFLVAGYLLIKSVFNEIKQKEQLQEAYKKLEELDRTKSEFVSIASHQLRTPLSAMKGYISMILEGSYGKLDTKQKKPLESISESNERLIRLVNDLLNVSRIESGKIEMKWEQGSMEEIIKSVVEELAIKAREKNTKLVFEEPESSLPLIRIDKEKIRNVLLNIVDNAIRYTPQGNIVVNAKTQMPNLLISVQDTGEGMTQEEIGKLFQTFSRGGAGMRFSTEGAGLGLYIAKKFLEMHKGRIWAESQGKGQGSTFFVELPVQ